MLRQRKRACRAQYGSFEFVVVESRQTATNTKMSRDEAGLTDVTVLKMHEFLYVSTATLLSDALVDW